MHSSTPLNTDENNNNIESIEECANVAVKRERRHILIYGQKKFCENTILLKNSSIPVAFASLNIDWILLTESCSGSCFMLAMLLFHISKSQARENMH